MDSTSLIDPRWIPPTAEPASEKARVRAEIINAMGRFRHRRHDALAAERETRAVKRLMGRLRWPRQEQVMTEPEEARTVDFGAFLEEIRDGSALSECGEKLQELVKAIIAGAISPDEDYRSMWHRLIWNTIEHRQNVAAGLPPHIKPSEA